MPPRGCTCLKCTNKARCAQTELSILLVQLRQLHPLEGFLSLAKLCFCYCKPKGFSLIGNGKFPN